MQYSIDMLVQPNTEECYNTDIQYLVLSHINPSDMALLAHQLTQNVAVPPTPTAQVQYPAALQTLWHQQTTSIVPKVERNTFKVFVYHLRIRISYLGR